MKLPTAIPLTISEKDFQLTVIEAAHLFYWRVHHSRPAPVRENKWVTPIQGDPGFPDLALARHGVLLLVELKRQHTQLAPAQRDWREAVGGQWRLWRPSDWNDGTILSELGR